jgi:hypothetical protein
MAMPDGPAKIELHLTHTDTHPKIARTIDVSALGLSTGSGHFNQLKRPEAATARLARFGAAFDPRSSRYPD